MSIKHVVTQGIIGSGSSVYFVIRDGLSGDAAPTVDGVILMYDKALRTSTIENETIKPS